MWRAEKDGCHLWRLMIDKRHQSRGYGRSALTLLFERLRAEGFKQISAAYLAGDGGPRDFHLALGFRETDEVRMNGERSIERSL